MSLFIDSDTPANSTFDATPLFYTASNTPIATEVPLRQPVSIRVTAKNGKLTAKGLSKSIFGHGITYYLDPALANNAFVCKNGQAFSTVTNGVTGLTNTTSFTFNGRVTRLTMTSIPSSS